MTMIKCDAREQMMLGCIITGFDFLCKSGGNGSTQSRA